MINSYLNIENLIQNKINEEIKLKQTLKDQILHVLFIPLVHKEIQKE